MSIRSRESIPDSRSEAEREVQENDTVVKVWSVTEDTVIVTDSHKETKVVIATVVAQEEKRQALSCPYYLGLPYLS